jgi:hypothetical protein
MSTKTAFKSDRTPSPDTYERKVNAILSIASQALLAQLDSGFIASPSDRNILMKKWESASTKYKSSSIPFRSYLMSDDLENLDQKQIDPQLVSNALNRAKLYPPYDSHPIQIYNINISKIITPQITLSEKRSKTRTFDKTNFSLRERKSPLRSSRLRSSSAAGTLRRNLTRQM